MLMSKGGVQLYQNSLITQQSNIIILADYSRL